MQRVITHVYNQKIRTACTTARTTALKNIHGTLGFTPSLHKIIDRLSQIFLNFFRLTTTAGKLSSESGMIHPMYLKDVDAFSGLP